MKFKLRDYQKQAIEETEAMIAFGSTNIMLKAPTSWGKEQPYSEKVLTPNGWKKMGDLTLNDNVIGSDGKPKKILGIYEQGEKDVYQINFLDGTNVKCGLEHLWTVTYATDNKKYSFMKTDTFTTQELMNKKSMMKQKRLYIKTVKPVEYAQVTEKLPIDPYMLGLLLGDGSFRGGKVSFSNNNKYIRQCIEENLDHDDKISRIEHNNTRTKCDIFISYKNKSQRSNLYNEIKKLGLAEHLSIEKFIPNIYKYGSIDTRRKVLQGLLDTDGYNQKPGYSITEFSTSSEKLAYDFIEMARSLGWIVNISSRIPKYKYKGETKEGKRNYRIHIRWKRYYKTISSIEKLNYKENSRCIKVESKDNLYVTSGFTLTHNTSYAAGICQAFTEEKIAIIVSFEELVHQIDETLDLLEIEHSIVKAGKDKHFDPDARIQLIMAQTLYARKDKLNLSADIVIFDEAHVAFDTKRTKEVIDHLSPRIRIGMSATPWSSTGFAFPDVEIVTTADYRELEKDGYITPTKYYVPKWAEKVDYSGIKKSGNDYNTKQIDEIVGSDLHLKNVLESMNQMNAKQKKTVVFCPSVEMADKVADILKQDGYMAASYHSKRSKKEQERIMKSFRYNQVFQGFDEDLKRDLFTEESKYDEPIKCLCAVSKLSIGFSVTDIDLGVMLRRTMILSLWHQIAGRIKRAHSHLEYMLDGYRKNLKIALILPYYDLDKDKIEKEMKGLGYNDFKCFRYTDTIKRSEFDAIVSGIRPTKEYGEMLDLAQCISNHGFPEDPYNPPHRTDDDLLNRQLLDKATEHQRLEHIIAVVDDQPTEINREIYIKRVEEIKRNKDKLTNLSIKDLVAKLEISEDHVEMIAIAAVLFDKIHSEDMIDDWGKPCRGYISNKGKPVRNFLNSKSIGWMSELWSEFLPKEDEYYRKKYIKSLRTRIKNLLKEKGSIYALRFFIEYLLEQDETEKMIRDAKEPASPEVLTEEQYKTQMEIIIEDEDLGEIPF